jgi:hypothetical protein
MSVHLKLRNGSNCLAVIKFWCEFINFSKCEMVAVHPLVVTLKFCQRQKREKKKGGSRVFGSRWGRVAFLCLLIGFHIKVPLPFVFLPHGFYALCLPATQNSIKLNFYFGTELAKNVFPISMNIQHARYEKVSAVWPISMQYVPCHL